VRRFNHPIQPAATLNLSPRLPRQHLCLMHQDQRRLSAIALDDFGNIQRAISFGERFGNAQKKMPATGK